MTEIKDDTKQCKMPHSLELKELTLKLPYQPKQSTDLIQSL